MHEFPTIEEVLAMNYPFVDGNKRTAFYATDAFLRMNGQYIDSDNLEDYEFFMDLFETHSF